jgi:hypothetical protein
MRAVQHQLTAVIMRTEVQPHSARSTKRNAIAWQSLNNVRAKSNTFRRKLRRVQVALDKPWATIAVSAYVPHGLASVTSFTLQPWFAPDVAQRE